MSESKRVEWFERDPGGGTLYVPPQTAQQMVTEFHRAFGAAIGAEPTHALRMLRARLISEEAGETINALVKGDMIAVADGLADLEYVVRGAAISLGIDLDKALIEVHRSNMAKLGPDGKPILREDGKVLKPAGWTPPDMTAAVKGVKPT